MCDESSIPTKVCTKCGRELPATTEFFRPHRQCRYGLRPDCRECSDTQRAAYRAIHRKELNAKQLARYVPVSETRSEHPSGDCERCGKPIPKGKRANARFCGVQCRERAKCSRTYQRVKADPERLARKRERGRKWAAPENRRERARLDAAERRLADPEGTRKAKRREYEKHRERYIERALKWQRDHPESKRATSSRRRSATGSHTAADIAAQISRQRGRCFWCKAKTGSNYHVDHVVPLAAGGSNDPENIVISCPACNLSKGAKHPMEWAGCLL